eukprot:10567620-Lingulodinium_polyedra.AAC.1
MVLRGRPALRGRLGRRLGDPRRHRRRHRGARRRPLRRWRRGHAPQSRSARVRGQGGAEGRGLAQARQRR